METDGGNTTVYCHNETVTQQDGDTVCDQTHKHICFITSVQYMLSSNSRALCEILLITTENNVNIISVLKHKSCLSTYKYFSDILEHIM